MNKPRYALQTDANQQEIIDALKAIGCQVVAIGTPVDLLVGYRARNFLIEVKNRETDYGKKDRGTKDQKKFISSWKGQVRKVGTAEEAIDLVTNSYDASLRILDNERMVEAWNTCYPNDKCKLGDTVRIRR